MRKNIVQIHYKTKDGRTCLDYDWFEKGIPGNVTLAKDVFVDTSYGFDAFHSLLPEAMVLGKGSGCYDRASFIVGESGTIEIGEFNIINGSTFICGERITVGNHCMFAWGSVITDSWKNDFYFSSAQRRNILRATANSPLRLLPVLSNSTPIVIEDNVWVGFDAVILPGVKLGQGCIVGSKSIVSDNIPAYSVVAGNPAKIIRQLDPDDTEASRSIAMKNGLSSEFILK